MQLNEEHRQKILNGESEKSKLQSEKKKVRAMEIREFQQEVAINMKFKAQRQIQKQILLEEKY